MRHEKTIRELILDVLADHGRVSIDAAQIRKEMIRKAGRTISDGVIFTELTRMYQRGLLRRFRTSSGRFVYRDYDLEEECFARTAREIQVNEERTKKEAEALTLHVLRHERRRTRIGEEFRVRIPNGNEEKETKWLKVIQKTEHLCIFEGYRSCQWVDVYKYRNGALNCVG